MIVNHTPEKERATCNRAQTYEYNAKKEVCTAPCCESYIHGSAQNVSTVASEFFAS
jgi:hypothetical protein